MIEARIDRLEARLAHIERTIIRIEQQRTVTKAKLADERRRRYNRGVRAAMAAAFTAALAAGATGAIVVRSAIQS